MKFSTLHKLVAWGFLGLACTQIVPLEARRGGWGYGGRGRGGAGFSVGFGVGGGRRGWGGGWHRGPGWWGGYYAPRRTVFVEPTVTTRVVQQPTVTTRRAQPTISSTLWKIRNRADETLVIENSHGDSITLAPGQQRTLAKGDADTIAITSEDGSTLPFENVLNFNTMTITESDDEITLNLSN